MAMREIVIPEAAAVIFLTLPFLRPHVKALRPLDGLVWMPVISLAVLAGISPAYGFRPECIPMLVLTAVFCILQIVFRGQDYLFFRRPVAAVLGGIMLSAAAAIMFIFSPVVTDGPDIQPKTITLNDGAHEYIVQIYGDTAAGRPLVFLVPPETGLLSVAHVCAALSKNNFTVVTYSRDDYDVVPLKKNGKKGRPSLRKIAEYQRILKHGVSLAAVNEQGRKLEAARRADIEFLLSRFPAAAGMDSLPLLLLVGYGAGGSALAYLAGEEQFVRRYGTALGVVVVESRLWQAFSPSPRSVPPVPAAAGFVSQKWLDFTRHLDELRPIRVERQGPLPGNGGIPVMYLVTGKALNSGGQKPYRAVFDSFRSFSKPAFFASLEGSGPLDYQDTPFTYPLYSFLQSSGRDVKKSKNPLGDTAAVIGNFAVFLLEQSGHPAPPRHPIDGSLYTESRGSSSFRLQ